MTSLPQLIKNEQYTHTDDNNSYLLLYSQWQISQKGKAGRSLQELVHYVLLAKTPWEDIGLLKTVQKIERSTNICKYVFPKNKHVTHVIFEICHTWYNLSHALQNKLASFLHINLQK